MPPDARQGCSRALCCLLLGLALSTAAVRCLAQEQQPAPPDLRIESFAATQPFAVGTEPLTLVGSIRNVGKGPQPAEQVNARLVCLASLGYLEGDTIPKLPALDPNSSVTFRWRVQPADGSGALVAALALESPGRPPQVRLLTLQHFAEAPRAGTPSAGLTPVARVAEDSAVIENGRVRARIVYSAANVPVMLLWARLPGGWREVAVSVPLAEVESAEGAQRPWTEVFRADDAQVSQAPGLATLSLTGGFGLRWRATLSLSLRAGSSVIDCRLRLSPLRPIRVARVRAWPLLAGASLGEAAAETYGPEPVGAGVVSAARWGAVTVGSEWPGAGPLAGWEGAILPAATGVDYRTIGGEWRAPGAPVELQVGTGLEVRGRIFALTPSRSAAVAAKVALPGGK